MSHVKGDRTVLCPFEMGCLVHLGVTQLYRDWRADTGYSTVNRGSTMLGGRGCHMGPDRRFPFYEEACPQRREAEGPSGWGRRRAVAADRSGSFLGGRERREFGSGGLPNSEYTLCTAHRKYPAG